MVAFTRSRQIGSKDRVFTRHPFDAHDRQVALVDANYHRTTFVYDAAGRNTVEIDPLDRRTTYAYDGVGRRTLKWDARDNRITMSYDAAGQLTLERYPDGRRHTFSYDEVGSRTAMVDPTGQTDSTYSSRNEVLTVTNPDGKRVTYTYDALQRRRTMRDPDDGRFTYAYDAAGRLSELVNPQNERTTFAYDAVDRQIQKRLANGNLTTQVYDPAGRMTGLVNAQSDGTPISRFTYTYDNVGNRTGVEQYNGVTTDPTIAWKYDKTYQLTNEQRADQLAWQSLTADQWAKLTADGWAEMEVAGAGAVFNVTYTYDPVGNRLTQQDLTAGRTTYAYDATNQLTTEEDAWGVTTYTYDNCGNRTQKDAPAGITYYSWDEDNRLVEAEPVAGPVTFTYNADGQRVRKSSESDDKKFLYDHNRLLQEIDAGTEETDTLYTSTVEEFGDLVSEYDTGTAASAYHQYDALGSTDALTDAAENVDDRYAYSAFGKLESHAGESDSPFTFVGRQNYYRDLEIELYFLAARYYDPATGQFTSQDPAEDDINPYRYVGNNPVSATDPSGLVDRGRWPSPWPWQKGGPPWPWEEDYWDWVESLFLPPEGRGKPKVPVRPQRPPPPPPPPRRARPTPPPPLPERLTGLGPDGEKFMDKRGPSTPEARQRLAEQERKIRELFKRLDEGGKLRVWCVPRLTDSPVTVEEIEATVGTVAEIAASMLPGVGEAMDVAVLLGSESAWWERGLAGGSLVISVLFAGFTPNVGSYLRGAKRVGCAVDTGEDIAKVGLRNLDEAGAGRRIADDVVAPTTLTRAATHGHHPLPKFLGGDTAQTLSRLNPTIHTEFHSLLRANLRKAGIPLNVGGRGGSAADWARYMNANPGAQRKAFDAVLDASRSIDVKHGTSVTQDVWNSVMGGSFTPHP